MKNASRPQYYRIRRILELIREGTRRGAYPNATDFQQELEVTWRTIMRDLDWLRDEEGAPIEYVASQRGYRLNDATWELRAVELTRRELFAFAVAGKVLAVFRGTPLETDVASVFRKIGESLEGKVTVDLAALTERFSVVAEDYVRQDPEIWLTLARHLERRERLRIVYERFDGEVKAYEVAPYHLCAYHGNWYLLAHHFERGRVATFALSRIRRVESTGESFEIPRDFDPQAEMAGAFGITGGDRPFKVRLLFARHVSGYVRERVWHPSQEVIRRRDGSVELRFETSGWKELVRWILSWQPDVKVLSPPRLRERVEEAMRQGLEEMRNADCGMEERGAHRASSAGRRAEARAAR